MVYEQGEVNGRVEKTPIIRRFENLNLAHPEHYNQAMMFTLTGIDNNIIKDALNKIVKHHDMLRVVYRNNELEILPSDESLLFDLYEFDYSYEADKHMAVESKCTEIQRGIDLSGGPLVKAAIFELGYKKIMMLCIHHLAIDGVSWRIIGEDLETVLRQIASDETIELPKKTASFNEWAVTLNEYSTSEEFEQDKKYWKKIIPELSNCELIHEFESDKFDGYDSIDISLTSNETTTLIKESHNAFNTEITDLLLSALSEAVYRYNEQDRVLVYLEGHGREQLHKNIDIDRTVGWFTSVYPVIIEASDDWDDTIVHNKNMYHSIPNKGIGYGLLKEDEENIDGIEFNYLGEFDESQNGKNSEEVYSIGLSIAETNKRECSISINGSVSNGILSFNISYDKNLYSDSGVKMFAQHFHDTLVEIGEYCVNKDETVITASDFDSSMDEEDFEGIVDLL